MNQCKFDFCQKELILVDHLGLKTRKFQKKWPKIGNFGHFLNFTQYWFLFGSTKSGNFCSFSNFSLIHHLKSAFLHRFRNIWGGGILENRPKISKIYPKKLGKFWPFTQFYPILMAFWVHQIWPFWLFFQFAFWQIVLKYQIFTLKSNQYMVKWKKFVKIPFSCHFWRERRPIY